MSKSLIWATNQSPQTVAANGIISLGSVQRRYGCNLRLSGNAIEADGQGYYDADIAVTVTPTAAETVSVALFVNGVQLNGAIASSAGTAGDPVTLPIFATLRQGCCCDNADTLTLVLLSGAGTVDNVSMRVTKE